MFNSSDFIKKTKYNSDTKNQLWCSVIADSHDSWCGCETPFAHLLASIFPPGHKDRKLTIDEILKRDYLECHSIGGVGESHGTEPTTTGAAAAVAGPKEEKDYVEDAELEELIKAGEDIKER